MRNDVVNVEDEPSTAPLGRPCGEDQKIRDVVDMDKVEFAQPAMGIKPLRRNHDKAQEWPQIRRWRSLILAESILDAVHENAINKLALG